MASVQSYTEVIIALIIKLWINFSELTLLFLTLGKGHRTGAGDFYDADTLEHLDEKLDPV